MELLQDLLENVPRTVWVLFALATISAIIWQSSHSLRMQAAERNEEVFKARPVLLLIFGVLALFFMWPAITGLGEPPTIRRGTDTFLLQNVLLRLILLCISAYFCLLIFILYRSFIRITPDEVVYFDGWRTRRRVPRNDILSAEVRHPGAILVVHCANPKDDFTVPLIAYSRAGLLAALLRRSAMRM